MVRYVELVNNGLTLRGMLHIPDNIRKAPLAILFHGFTGHKQELHRIFVKMSRTLECNGIMSLRFDFAGSGDSDGDFHQMTFSSELSDAEAILDYGLSLENIDKDKCYLIGLSMGGAIASVLAGKRPKEISKLCLWAPAGDLYFIINQLIKDKGKEYDSLNYYDYIGNEVGKKFLSEIKGLDIYQLSKGFPGYVLIIQGEMDEVVPLENAYKYKRIYNENCNIHMIKEANHVFENIAWEKEVIARTLEFLKR